jgi:hypothetical protein
MALTGNDTLYGAILDMPHRQGGLRLLRLRHRQRVRLQCAGAIADAAAISARQAENRRADATVRKPRYYSRPHLQHTQPNGSPAASVGQHAVRRAVGVEQNRALRMPAIPHTPARCALKNHAAPPPWVPSESSTANHRCWRYDDRCRSHNDGRWCNDGRRRRYDDRRHDDRPSVGPAGTVGITMPAGTTSAFGTGAVEGHD